MMNRTLALLTCILLFFYGTARAQDALMAGFKNPPSSAKARTWWHWIDGNVTKHGITADLEAMKRVGIQEAQIFNVGQGFPEGPAKYMSPQWLDLVHFAATEAKRLGLELAFHNSAGWSSTGGPWVKPENAMQTVVYSEVRVKGGDMIHRQLPKPTSKFNFYRDIAVLAFPTPKKDVRIDQLGLKSLSGDQFKVHLQPDDKVIDKAAVISKAQVIDLSSKMSAEGVLDWAAPPGEWTVVRFGHTPTGAENRPSVPDGKGLEIDKMSRKAVDVHWAGGIKPVLDKLGPLVGTVLNNCLIDSYEVGCNNWTSGFATEFKKRCGYDIIPFLPTLAGYYVESGEISERFLWDFRKTIGDMIAENYYGYFGQLCHQAGMKFSVEPYGGPFDAAKAGAAGDVVMGEFWLGSNSYSESSKLAASIAHIKGSNIVGAESFTSTGGWLTHPGSLKNTGDRMWTNGVNRFIFHTYTHQPWDLKPGLTFHMYGLDMNRHNTWWEQSLAYMDYIARSQYLLQSGKSFADVLVFAGEGSPNDAMLRPDINALGYDYDQIWEDDLAMLTVKNGKLYTPAGLSYSVLLLPQTTWVTPKLLQKLKELSFAGAKIFGPKPSKSPSLIGYPGGDMMVKRLANELWPAKIADQTSLPAIFKKLQLAPDLSAETGNAGINYIHRVNGTDDIYFIANLKNVAASTVLSFRVTGKQPALWDPSTGQCEQVLVWSKGAGNTTRVPLELDANGSMFVIFSKPTVATPQISSLKQNFVYPKPLPLAGLKIVKAEYGTFLPEGMADVTDAVIKAIKTDQIHISATNSLLPDDPAPGSVKELRVEYQLDGLRQQLRLVEGQSRDIDLRGKKFTMERALYGKFTQEFKGVPPKYPVYDVTQKVTDLINANNLTFTVSDKIFGVPAATAGVGRELRMSFYTDDELQTSANAIGEQVHLEQSMPCAKVILKDKVPTLVSPYQGQVSYTSSGQLKTASVKEVPGLLVLSGPWDVSFTNNLKEPINRSFAQLTSWARSDEESIRHYSGTAVYKKTFDVGKEMVGRGRSLELDLGSVRVLAQVFVNGKDLGVLWTAPFRIDVSDAMHAGTNQIEIRVTNLWVNRLIGDAQLPDDLKWGDGPPAAWPEWLQDSSVARASKRVTFATWRHWDAKATLKPSGLLGPVLIRTYLHQKL